MGASTLFNEDSLEKKYMTGLFLLLTLPDLKTDTNHLLQGHHSSSSLMRNLVNSTTA